MLPCTACRSEDIPNANLATSNVGKYKIKLVSTQPAPAPHCAFTMTFANHPLVCICSRFRC